MPDSTGLDSTSQAAGRYIKDNQILDNDWTVIAEDFEGELPTGKVLLPLNYVQANPALTITDNIGLWLQGDCEVETLGDDANRFSVIAVNFPTFMDGRGFSVATLLRSRYNYSGELRAIGGVIRDQLFYLKRSGFNSFVLNNQSNLEGALESLQDFSETYQSSVDSPEPLYRRQAL